MTCNKESVHTGKYIRQRILYSHTGRGCIRLCNSYFWYPKWMKTSATRSSGWGEDTQEVDSWSKMLGRASMPINLIIVHMFAHEPNGVPPYNCALTSNGWTVLSTFSKTLSQIIILRLAQIKFFISSADQLFFFFCIDRLTTPKDVSVIVVSFVLYGGIKATSVETSVWGKMCCIPFP